MIDLKTIKYLEKLSALQYEDCELENLQKDLQEIEKFVQQIQEINLNDKLNPERTINISSLREDDANLSLEQQEILQNAPLSKKGAFAVPKMLD